MKRDYSNHGSSFLLNGSPFPPPGGVAASKEAKRELSHASRGIALSALEGQSVSALFEKDLAFFQLLLVLMNKSCAIRSVDLVWRSNNDSNPALVQITGTVQALSGPAARYVASESLNPTPQFCEIVNSGCLACDRAAEARVGLSGKPEVYRCHAGLIDIAVPVVCEGRHIATLFTGQVHRSLPDESSFRQVLQDVRGLPRINHEQLKAAYFKVPVVSDEDIQHTVSILEIFASYLATTWTRLLAVSSAQQLHLRERYLLRKEMAQILLDGLGQSEPRLREIAGILGFSRLPNQMMVIQLPDESKAGQGAQSDLERAQAVFALEDLTDKMKEIMAVHLRRQGICVFLVNDSGDAQVLGEAKVYSLAQKIVSNLRQKHRLNIRVGIGRKKEKWHRLSESMQEAWASLAESAATIAVYKDPTVSFGLLSNQIAVACRALSGGDLSAASAALQLVFVSAYRLQGNSHDGLEKVRHFLLLAFDMILLSAQGLPYDLESLDALKREATQCLECTTSVSELHDAWIACVQNLLSGTKSLYSGRHEKLVDRAGALIQRKIDSPEGCLPISIAEIAADLGVSEGHLSRTFKKISGTSLEQYVIQRRIERACQLLLDPANRVSDVAEKCDFCNSTYFARVFRKTVGCSPSDFSQHPSKYPAARVLQHLKPRGALDRVI